MKNFQLKTFWNWLKNTGNLFYVVVIGVIAFWLGKTFSHHQTVYIPQSPDTVTVEVRDTVLRWRDRLIYTPVSPINTYYPYYPFDTLSLPRIARVEKNLDIKIYLSNKIYTYPDVDKFRIIFYGDKVYFQRVREFPVKWDGVWIGYETHKGIFVEARIKIKKYIDIYGGICYNRVWLGFSVRLF